MAVIMDGRGRLSPHVLCSRTAYRQGARQVVTSQAAAQAAATPSCHPELSQEATPRSRWLGASHRAGHTCVNDLHSPWGQPLCQGRCKLHASQPSAHDHDSGLRGLPLQLPQPGVDLEPHSL